MRRRFVALGCAVAACFCAGNPLSYAQAVTSHWTNSPTIPGFYSWDNAGNWSTNPNYPHNGTPTGTTYNAIIDPVSNGTPFTINTPGGTTTVDSLTLNCAAATLSITGSFNTFSAPVGGVNIQAGTMSFSSGTLVNTTISGGSVSVENATGKMDHVTLSNTNVLLRKTISDSLTFDLANGLVLDHSTVTLQDASGNNFQLLHQIGTNTISGSGEIVFNATSGSRAVDVISTDKGGVLTIGPGITVRNGTGPGAVGFGSGAVTNQGTISAQGLNSDGSALFMDVYGVNNTGTLQVKDGAMMTLTKSWSNSGTIVVNNGMLTFDGTDTLATIGHVTRTGGIVNFGGTLNNTGKVLDLSTTQVGPLDFLGAVVNGGTLTASNRAIVPTVRKLQLWDTGSSLSLKGTIFNGVTLDTDVNVNVGTLGVNNGITLNNRTISLQAGDPTLDPTLYGAFLSIPNSNLSGSGVVSLDGLSSNNRIGGSGTITIGPQITIRTGAQGGTIGSTATTFINQGTIAAITNGKEIGFTAGTLTNQGTLQAGNGGTLRVLDQVTLTNLSNNTLTGGTYLAGAGSTISLDSRTFTTDAANVTLDGVGSTLAAIAPLATITSAGAFAIDHGRNFATVGALSNAGLLRVGAGSTLTVNGTLTNTGTIKGKGTIVGNINNSGTISPGESPGMLTITGNVVQDAAGLFDIEIAGPNAGVDYDQLIVTGDATLSGTLRVTLLNGYIPQPGQTFDFVQGGSEHVNFSNVVLPAGLGWDTSSLSSGQITALPEPAGAISILGLIAAASSLRQRRSTKPQPQ